MKQSVLLAGESWVSTSTHIKGFDQFDSVTAHNGARRLLAEMADSDYQITQMCADQAQTDFPATVEALSQYQAVILSDIGANTLLLHPDTWLRGKRTPNRLKALREYVLQGGALMMVGGYFSFQGINGGARYRGTPVEEVLPVRCLPYDDRVEVPEGFLPQIHSDHPILRGLGGEWPYLLGYNEVELHPEAQLLATVEGSRHPLLAAREVGAGRTLAWTSDLSEHWLPEVFLDWEGYRRFWINSLDWLTRRT
ncbi:glutamine amidotransferase [Pseudomonas syringae]|uniref:glutamine amidotransferase n=1 Tax=Pseudomonas TaxID=286 RepID=UPI0003FAAE1D|nr:glutamine amidotransferase [Pseudomonas syringae]MCF5030011.1 hypothetical protein [Pseudomonas syringae]POD15242.1 beta-galactosidase [Pseudomonas syringae pv. syringae]POR63951.1 beta-galactosidase [Pseudomonas syringae pv. syringae]QGG74550.1 hypothetical protein N028_03855 [Pseudomonas syringae USA011]UQB20937.1 hypothetical protein I9H08_03580 [Pseudomonas syringae pv. syringae]